MTDRIVVLSSCGSQEEAERLAHMLVGQQFAACVNVLPGIRSIYRWKGAVESSHEAMLLIKTTEDKFPELRDALRAAHSYELPEIVALPIVDGLPEYLEWLGSGKSNSQ